MLDIVEFPEGKDMSVSSTAVSKAANVLSVQLASLEYAQDFGVDLRFFFESDLQFQNASFKAYLVQRLVESQINVSDVTQVIEALDERLTFYVGDSAETKGFIR